MGSFWHLPIILAMLVNMAPVLAFAVPSQCQMLFTIEAKPASPFEISHRYIEAELSRFINVPPGQRTSFGPFLASYHIQNGEMYDTNQRFIDFALGAFSLNVSRGRLDASNLPELVGYSANMPIVKAGHGRLVMGFQPREQALRNVETSLEAIYESFASQGKERQILVPIVKGQDATEIDRVTHFTYLANHWNSAQDTLGHVQILTSRSANEKLHVETQWGDVHRLSPNEIIGEVGRLIFIPDEALSENAKQQLSRERKAFLRASLLQKAYTWAINDLRADRLFFQVNTKVAIVLEKVGLPISQSKVREVSSRIGGEDIKELIVEMDRQQLKQAEESLMKRVLEYHLKRFLGTPAASGGKLIMRYSRNEFPVLFRLGVIAINGERDWYGYEELKARDFSNRTLFAEDYFDTILSPRILRVLSNDFEKPAHHSADFFLNHRVSFATPWSLPPLPRQKGALDARSAPFTISKDDLEGRNFLELHFSEAAAKALIERLQHAGSATGYQEGLSDR